MDTVGRVFQMFFGIVLALISVGCLVGTAFMLFDGEEPNRKVMVIAGVIFGLLSFSLLYISIQMIRGYSKKEPGEYSSVTLWIAGIFFLAIPTAGIVHAIREGNYEGFNWIIMSLYYGAAFSAIGAALNKSIGKNFYQKYKNRQDKKRAAALREKKAGFPE